MPERFEEHPDSEDQLHLEWNELLNTRPLPLPQFPSDAGGAMPRAKTPPPIRRKRPKGLRRSPTRSERLMEGREDSAGELVFRLAFPGEDFFYPHLGQYEQHVFDDIREEVLEQLLVFVENEFRISRRFIEQTHDAVIVHLRASHWDACGMSQDLYEQEGMRENFLRNLARIRKSIVDHPQIGLIQKNWFRKVAIPKLMRISAERAKAEGFDDKSVVWLSKRMILLTKEGQGANGVVFGALDYRNGEFVALKVIPHIHSDASPQERLFFAKQEGRNQAQVPLHPNIVQVKNAFHSDDQSMVVMEWVHGVDLGAHMQMELMGERRTLELLDPQDGNITKPGVFSILKDLFAALRATHEAGVVHRDVKPSNLFVSKDGTIKLGDFGVSLSSRPLSYTQQVRRDTFMSDTGMKSVVGTLMFLCPQYLNTTKAEFATDMWSAGVVAYLLLAGVTDKGRLIYPYRARGVGDVIGILQKGGVDIPSLGIYRSDLPPGLITLLDDLVIRGLLDMTPSNRLRPDEALKKVTVIESLVRDNFFVDQFGVSPTESIIDETRDDIADELLP